MGVKTRSQDSQPSSERQKWDKIFEGLVQMLKSQQQQLETLAKERKIFEDRIKMQYERWVSDVRLYEDHISQMKRDVELKEMARVLESAKSDMMVGLKHREAFLFKLRLEETEDELADFRVWFDFLSNNSRDISQRNPKKGKSGCKDSGSKLLEGEMRKLKLEYENLASENKALLAENKFAWNQFNLLESQFTDKLNSKNSELEDANRKIETLISNMEELRSSNAGKDQVIERLKVELSQKEADASRVHEGVSKKSREVELLRKSKSASSTPVMKRCTAGKTSVMGNKNGGLNGVNVTVKKDSAPDLLKDSGMGTRSSKRKMDEVITLSETPKLFTSKFKVPRLKASSSRSR